MYSSVCVDTRDSPSKRTHQLELTNYSSWLKTIKRLQADMQKPCNHQQTRQIDGLETNAIDFSKMTENVVNPGR